MLYWEWLYSPEALQEINLLGTTFYESDSRGLFLISKGTVCEHTSEQSMSHEKDILFHGWVKEGLKLLSFWAESQRNAFQELETHMNTLLIFLKNVGQGLYTNT